MDSNFSNRDFEQFVKQNADQYRMFPSDKVWKGINNTLHTRRKWYGFWLGFLLLVTGAAVTWVMSSHPALQKPGATVLNRYTAKTSEQQPVTVDNTRQPIEQIVPLSKPQYAVDPTAVNATVPQETSLVGPSTFADNDFDFNTDQSPAVSEPGLDRIVPPVMITRLPGTTDQIIGLAAQPIADNISIGSIAPTETKTNRQPVAVRKEQAQYPMTIESVLNSYQFKKTPKRISWQLFVTPTISYRRLSLNKSIDNPSSLNYPFAALSDVNSAVTHKPDLGLQIGLSGRYAITRSVKLRGGFQFNINRYDIKAYAFNGEVATIDLNGGPGNGTISTWTNYRNFNGYRPNWLKNFYFSFSVPVGAELKLFGNSKTYVGIAGTAQPTYVLSDQAYLLSTDYKNYAEVPRLIRHVNLNTSFETFVNYHSGKANWQIGPQVRYQVLSSFQSTYPVKENLFDFGLKVGLTLNK